MLDALDETDNKGKREKGWNAVRLTKTDTQNQTIKGEGEKGREKPSSPSSARAILLNRSASSAVRRQRKDLLSEDVKNTDIQEVA
ncbi:MAG: hypothetical protein CVT47_02175 [Thermoplasmata archaeon HGW-Thermoplasmata-2]|nr:MAG: hypothetical protein CVT47_02175 [Thermoplasmata archaeon HGW-Thermoplasmata-2]